MAPMSDLYSLADNQVRRLLPKGTRPGRTADWALCPFWPPDVFAVAATFLNRTGAYVSAEFTALWRTQREFDKEYLSDVAKLGEAWGQGQVPTKVQSLWNEFRNTGSALAAMKLLTIADQASWGVGFVRGGGALGDYLLYQHQRLMRRGPKGPSQYDLPHLPYSLCWLVPTDEACVQPKTMTPQVGCTLRSLSHHLALVPPKTEIATSWLFGTAGKAGRQGEPLNLLLVPFPFRVDGDCFSGEESPGEDGQRVFRFFRLQQNWLRPQGRKLSASTIGRFLVNLVSSARREVRRVDGIVLPEAALEKGQAAAVARFLAKHSDLEMFISGAVDAKKDSNEIHATLFHERRVSTTWHQAKHHRWRLDAAQVRRYHLGDALNPRYNWWERISFAPRACTFYVFRHGASLAALVCEDLARIDPAQAALRAVGPNLVIVLLMDGPQFERRWPGRYATVLADDPGSSVLTLTSLGMVKRSQMPGDPPSRQIALWKDRSGRTQELSLPDAAHALLLTLSQTEETCHTLDGRPDDNGTIRLDLSGVRPVRHPNPPRWLDA
jgi:hypothetical protein